MTNVNLVIACGMVGLMVFPAIGISLIILNETLLSNNRNNNKSHTQSLPNWLTLTTMSFTAYLIMFLPTCGIVQHGMVQMGGDRYAYVPYLGLCGIVATGAYGVFEFLLDVKNRTHKVN